MKLKCHCGKVYDARPADIKRGWAKTCSKRCAAIKRAYERPNATTLDGDKVNYGKRPKRKQHSSSYSLNNPSLSDFDREELEHQAVLDSFSPFDSGYFGHGQE